MRRIGNHSFILTFTRAIASDAQRDAQALRRDGFLARIITRRVGGRGVKLGGHTRYLFFDVYRASK